jgi:hypothetical protein
LVASLGASLSMIVAGSLALMTVSTVVAFQGWPGISTADPIGAKSELAALDAGTRAGAPSKPVVLAAPRHASTTRTAKRHAAASRPVHTAALTTIATPKSQTHPTSHAVVAVQPKPATSIAPATQKRTTTAGDPVRKVGAELGGSVSDAGEQLGNAVGSASPQLGDVVKKVTDVVAHVVSSATDMLGRTLDLVSGAKTP